MTKKCISIVSLRDNEFSIDKAFFDEIIDVEDDFTERSKKTKDVFG